MIRYLDIPCSTGVVVAAICYIYFNINVLHILPLVANPRNTSAWQLKLSQLAAEYRIIIRSLNHLRDIWQKTPLGRRNGQLRAQPGRCTMGIIANGLLQPTHSYTNAVLSKNCCLER